MLSESGTKTVSILIKFLLTRLVDGFQIFSISIRGIFWQVVKLVYSKINISETSRERPKSGPYLRLKKTRKPLFLQLETTKALKKLKIEKKSFRIFL